MQLHNFIAYIPDLYISFPITGSVLHAINIVTHIVMSATP